MAATRFQARLIGLAKQIVEHAARDGWKAGRHVTEQELCLHLGVSRTPVRSALRVLEREGILEARPKQGFLLRVEGRAALGDLHLTAPPTEEEALYARMLRERLTGSLPAEVTRATLARRYGVGRVVLEHVVGRLTDDGLLRPSGGRALKFVASTNDAGSVRASYELRLMLEPAAILLPGFGADPASLDALRSRHLTVLEGMDVPRSSTEGLRRPLLSSGQLVTLDADFHDGLATFSGNPFVVAVIRQQTDLRRLLEFTANEDAPRVRVWLLEHLAIIEALAEGALERAATALRVHLLHAAQRSAEALGITD